MTPRIMDQGATGEAFAAIGVQAIVGQHLAITYDTTTERDHYAARNVAEYGHAVQSALWHHQPVNLITLHVAPPIEDDPAARARYESGGPS